MHYTDNEEFLPDADRMQAVRDLINHWNGVDLYGALNVIGATLALTEHPPFDPCDEELTDERHVGTTGVAHRLTCPHCGDMLSGLLEIDWSVRENRADVDPHDGSLLVAQGSSDYETLAFMCPTCRGFGEVPDDAEVRWY